MKGICSIIECVFDKCKSINMGGAIWNIGNGTSLTSLIISHLFFNNSVSSLELGTDIAFESDDLTILNEVLTSTNISFCRSQNDKLEVVNNSEGILFIYTHAYQHLDIVNIQVKNYYINSLYYYHKKLFGMMYVVDVRVYYIYYFQN
jgi:hypothetical protein